MILLVMANAIPKLQPKTVSQNFTTQPSQLAAKRPVTKDETQAKLETMLPESVMAGFEKAGFKGALEAIQKLEGKELKAFANDVADISGVEEARDPQTIKAELQTPEGQNAFIKSMKATFKAAMDNPKALENNPQAFVKEQVRQQISDLSKPESAAKNTAKAEKAAPVASNVIPNSVLAKKQAQQAKFLAASNKSAAAA